MRSQRTLRETLPFFIFRTDTLVCPYIIFQLYPFLSFLCVLNELCARIFFPLYSGQAQWSVRTLFSLITFSFISLRAQRTLRENLFFFVFRTGTGACPYMGSIFFSLYSGQAQGPVPTLFYYSFYRNYSTFSMK